MYASDRSNTRGSQIFSPKQAPRLRFIGSFCRIPPQRFQRAEPSHAVAQMVATVLSLHGAGTGPRPLSSHLHDRPGKNRAPRAVRALEWPQGRDAPMSLQRGSRPHSACWTPRRTSSHSTTPSYALPLAKTPQTLRTPQAPRRTAPLRGSSSAARRLHVPTYVPRGKPINFPHSPVLRSEPTGSSRGVPIDRGVPVVLPHAPLARGDAGSSDDGTALSSPADSPLANSRLVRLVSKETVVAGRSSEASAVRAGRPLPLDDKTTFRKLGSYSYRELDKRQQKANMVAIAAAFKDMADSDSASNARISAGMIFKIVKQHGKTVNPSTFWTTLTTICRGKQGEGLSFADFGTLMLERLATAKHETTSSKFRLRKDASASSEQQKQTAVAAAEAERDSKRHLTLQQQFFLKDKTANFLTRRRARQQAASAASTAKLMQERRLAGKRGTRSSKLKPRTEIEPAAPATSEPDAAVTVSSNSIGTTEAVDVEAADNALNSGSAWMSEALAQQYEISSIYKTLDLLRADSFKFLPRSLLPTDKRERTRIGRQSIAAEKLKRAEEQEQTVKQDANLVISSFVEMFAE